MGERKKWEKEGRKRGRRKAWLRAWKEGGSRGQGEWNNAASVLQSWNYIRFKRLYLYHIFPFDFLAFIGIAEGRWGLSLTTSPLPLIKYFLLTWTVSWPFKQSSHHKTHLLLFVKSSLHWNTQKHWWSWKNEKKTYFINYCFLNKVTTCEQFKCLWSK